MVKTGVGAYCESPLLCALIERAQADKCASFQIITSSKYLGLLPSTLGSMDLVDWIPVDLLGNIIVELAGAAELRHEPKNGFHDIDVEPIETVPVYHAVNPEFSMWADLVPTVHNSLGDSSIKIVTWSKWVNALSMSQHSAADLTQNPGLKLLDFFEALKRDADAGLMLPRLDTERSEVKSGALAGLKPVGAGWMKIWLKQWAF